MLRSSRVMQDAPEDVIQRAIGLWQHGGRAAASVAVVAGGPLRRMLARLASDSAVGASPLAFGQRGTVAPVRQLVFCAEGCDIDLRIVADTTTAPGTATERWRLSGQALGPVSQGRIELFDAAGRSVVQAPVDELGEFRLPPVARGTYVLAVQFEGVTIEMPPFGVPAAGMPTG